MDPKRLGKYEIGAKIGQGAMGNVHRAHDPILNRDVAIKTMSTGVDSDDELRRRFHREAQSAARLNHPNIITVYDFGEEQGQMYIAMELLEGADLKEVITRQRPLSLDAKLDLMDQICDGLAFAHARGVIHRDLKPANIHLQQDGKVKIMDFGLARISSATDLTGAGMMLGTPNYMSPEQVRGEKASTRSDVFSLGVVFYELLAGRKAFDADSMAGVLFQVMQKDPEPLERIRSELGPVSAVVQRALAKDPALRFGDARELRDALRDARQAVRSEAVRPRAVLPRPPGRETPSGAGTLVRAIGPEAGATQTVRALEAADETMPTPISSATQRPGEAATLPRADLAEVVEPTVVASRGPWTERTERPEASRPLPPETSRPTPRREPAPHRGPSLPVLLAGGGALALAGSFALWLALRPGLPEPAPTQAADRRPAVPIAEPPPIPPPSTTVAPSPPESGLAEAERSLRDKDYRTALALAERVKPGDEAANAAKRVAAEARRALRAADETAARFERALLARDPERASQALSSLLAEDPRRPDTAALAARLNEALRQPRPQGLPSPTATLRATAPGAAPATTLAAVPVAPPTTLAAPAPSLVPAPTLPSPPTTTPSPQSETAARQAIRGVLDEYRASFERRDADALRAVQPGIDYDAMKKTFASVTGYVVRVDVKEVTVKGDVGQARCVVIYEPQPKPAQKIPPQSTVFHLRRTGDVWLIERLERR